MWRDVEIPTDLSLEPISSQARAKPSTVQFLSCDEMTTLTSLLEGAAALEQQATRNTAILAANLILNLTMRLSDAGLRRRPTKLIYPDHRPSPFPNGDEPRDRSNRLLDASSNGRAQYRQVKAMDINQTAIA